MDFTDVVRKRRMVRNFTPEPVEPEVIERIVTLTRRAPSAGFAQGQSFIVVTQEQTKKEIAKLCREEEYTSHGVHPFLSTAPVLIVACTCEAAYHRRYQKVVDAGEDVSWHVPFWHMDAGCAVMVLLLAVVNEGLAASFAGLPSPEYTEELKALLHIPAEVMPVGVLPIGHPAPDVGPPRKRSSKPDEEYVHYEMW